MTIIFNDLFLTFRPIYALIIVNSYIPISQSIEYIILLLRFSINDSNQSENNSNITTLMKKFLLLPLFITLCIFTSFAAQTPTGNPVITFHSDAYKEIGADNLASVLISTTENTQFKVQDAMGVSDYEFVPMTIDSETGAYLGTWIQISVPEDGTVKMWGDPSKVEAIIADGLYITEADFASCSNLAVLSLCHNSLKKLDLSDFNQLYAIYLGDNTFTKETPLKIGPNKPNLQILEMDIMEYVDSEFDLSDYPALVSFDGYHNFGLTKIDPSGCPALQSLSLDMTNVSELDVTHNPRLTHLNISDTRITSIDLSQNPYLQRLFVSHDSGSVNYQYRLGSIDLSHNPLLYILNLNGNRLGTIDISNNPQLYTVFLNRNSLKTLDVSNNSAINSLFLMDNDMDFATLPLPGTYFEYFYRQNAMPVPRAIAVNSDLDMSDRVLRDGTNTTVTVWRQRYDGEDEQVSSSAYTYADGVIRFNQVFNDSIYVSYANDVFVEYPMKTTPFKVRNASELGQPSNIASFVSADSGSVSFGVGMQGASADNPKTFLVDFGDGNRQEFKATSQSALAVRNVTGTPNGKVDIYIPEGEVMTSLNMSGIALASVNVTAATELTDLSLKGCGLYDVNLTYNRCLTKLDLSDNNLAALNLAGIYGDYEKNVLNTLDASGNNIAEFTCMATGAMKNLNLADNRLTEINLKDYDNLLTLDLSGNQISSVNFEYLYSAESIDISDNMISEITPCATHNPERLVATGNALSFGTLLTPDKVGEEYLYAPQQDIMIQTESPIVNLKDYLVTVDGNPTTLTWKKADGSILTEGTDYSVTNGVTTFLDSELGVVYAELANATFPALAGDNALKTTRTTVVEGPTHLVASFKTLKLTDLQPSIIFASTEPVMLYIDWKGDYTDLQAYNVETTYKEYMLESINRNADVKIYATSADVAAKINVFSIYNIVMTDVDLSHLTKAYAISLGGCGLSPQDITMPENSNLGELNLTGNKFSEFPYFEKFPNLAILNLGANEFKTFDASRLPNLQYLTMSDNQLTDITFDNDQLWNIAVDINKFETIDLNGLPALEQLILNSNNLSTIDLTPVKNTLNAISLVGNRFDFTTLPLPDDYAHLNVYYYGNQQPLETKIVDMKADLSSQYDIYGEKTAYAWFRGIPEYNAEMEIWEGDQLIEGADYTISNGVTTFLKPTNGQVMCLMTNSIFPNLTLYTNLMSDDSGISGICTETADGPVYNLQGIRVADSIRDVRPGLYIVAGKKILKN